jgi:hypothetical protein
MVYNTQNHCVCVLCPSSGILNTRKYNVSETVFVLCLGEGKETPLCWVPKFSLPSSEDRDSVSYSLCYLKCYLKFLTMEKVQRSSDSYLIRA